MLLKSTTRKLALAALLAGTMLGATAVPAVAQATNGATGTWGAAPWAYKNWARIDNGVNAKTAITNVQNTSQPFAPAFSMQANARLYRSDTNALCTASGYITNGVTTTVLTVSTNHSYCVLNGLHYSLGQTKTIASGGGTLTYATYIAGPLTF